MPKPETYVKHLTDFGEFPLAQEDTSKQLRALASMICDGEILLENSSSSKLYLRQVNSMAEVSRLLELLSNDGPMMCDRMIKTQGFYLEAKCGIPVSSAASIARECLGYRVCVATRDYLAGLLIHLSTLITTSGWDSAKEELDFHVRELNLSRTRPMVDLLVLLSCMCIFVISVKTFGPIHT